jgi:orotate phosphoribosyltransferase
MESPADAALRILTASGALLSGDHFVYVSGQHSSGWIDNASVCPHAERTSELASLIAAAGRRGAEIVCGPATDYAHAPDYLKAGGHWPP